MGQKDAGADLEKAEAQSNTSRSLAHTTSTSPGLTKEPDLPAVAAPPANTEEVLELVDLSAERTHSESSSHPESNERPQMRRNAPSVASSTVQPDPIQVPRKDRRGLLAGLAIIAEVEDPKDYPRRTKWFLTFIVAIAAAAAPMGSSIILPALLDIAKAFNSTPTVTNLSVALYMLSMSIFPLWWSSFSETLGRRTIYVVSFTLFLIFNILSAISVNISMFIVMRILSGGASASVQAVGAGTIADIWAVRERGRAMGIFYLGPLGGPLLAPILGGVLAQTLGWRSCLWSQAVYGVILWFMIIFGLPETLKSRKPLALEAEAEAEAKVVGNEQKDGNTIARPTLSRTTTNQSVKVKAKKYGAILRRCFVDPLAIILHLRKPPVALSVYYASVTFGSLYFLNISVQQTFSIQPYNYSVIIVGLLYIPNSVGYFIASLFGGKWVDRIMHREARKAGRYDERGKLVFRPEDRMRENIWMAAFLYPAALIWYGWTAEKGVNVVAPMIANFWFGIGSMLVFGCISTMLTEFMPNQSSHGLACNNAIRNIFSCVAGIVAEPLIVAIGNGWLFTIIGIWCLGSGIIVIWSMKHYADRWHANADGE